MRVQTLISVSGSCLGHNRVDLLRREWPGAIDEYGSIEVCAGEDEPMVRGVLDRLREWGWEPHDPWVSFDKAKNFRLTRTRVYDAADMEGLELLQIWPAVSVEIEWPSPGAMGVRRGQYKRKADFARGRIGAPIIVPQRVRTLMEAADFRGLHFEPLQLLKRVGGSYDWPKLGQIEWATVGEPWWILDSILTLPPVGPYLCKYGRNCEIIPNTTRGGGMIREPGFDDVERHYLRSDLEKLGDFDVAREWESGGAVEIVVSKRFYEFCKAHNLKCGFKPVRIDEG